MNHPPSPPDPDQETAPQAQPAGSEPVADTATDSSEQSELIQLGTGEQPTTQDSKTLGVQPDSSPSELVQWGLEKFADLPIVLTTSYGMEGCVLMDMCSKAIAEKNLPPLTIACIDTGFFFPETKQLRKKLIEKYTNLNFVSWETPVSVDQQREKYGPTLWKNNPNLCCNIRKVQPMSENVVKYRVWITALRRSQTKQRANTEVLSWDWKYNILKFCPMASLTRADVWSYIQKFDVPFNQLHLQNYPSVSCYHCTKAVPGSTPDSEVREGRWAGKDKTECGLHYSI